MKIDYANRIFGLDLMRALAILLVIGSHILWVFPELQGGFYTIIKLSGVMGVELFFVLSGFLIGRLLIRIYLQETYSPKDFLYFIVRRWFRTFPNYYLILLLNIFIVGYLGRDLPETLGLYFGFLQNTTFGMDIFFTESWSLPVEEFAYILGPLLLYLGVLLFPKTKRKTLFLSCTLLILTFFFFTKVYYNSYTGSQTLDYWNIHLKAVVIYRIDAIYYGVLAAFISIFYEDFWKNNKSHCFFLSLFLFVLIHLAMSKLSLNSENTPFFMNVLYLPLCSLCISLSLPLLSQWKQTPRFILVPVTFVSVISYAMYLLHYSVILQLMNYWFLYDNDIFSNAVLFSLSYFMITILLSFLLYVVYEKPMMDLRDHPTIKKIFTKG